MKSLFLKALSTLLLFGTFEWSNSVLAGQTVILISIDGLRWDYPEKADTPNIDYLIEHGVRAKSLIPCFPTKTFPNHYSMVTGLYPQNHGIIANNMYDPERNEYFRLSLREAVRDPAWWGGEPIWVTAEKNGLIAASYFWPGSGTKIKGTLPTYWYEYDGSVSNEARMQQLLKWLDLPEESRPSLLLTYFSVLDDAGHDYGPESVQVKKTIQYIDSVLGILIDGVKQRGLLASVNIIVVSDHGMAAISPERVIFLDDYIEMKHVDIVDWNPVAAINPFPGAVDSVYHKLVNAHPHMKVYPKDEIPARFNYRDHHRITQILAIADEGWSITSHATVKPEYISGGNHGFDNQARSMGATFIAAGPAFKSGLTVPPFQNVHIYELLAEVLDVPPAANDGSLDSVRVLLRGFE